MKSLGEKIKIQYFNKAFTGHSLTFRTSLYKPEDTANRNINSILGSVKEL